MDIRHLAKKLFAHLHINCTETVVLTDVVVALSLLELLAQREGGVALELLGELLGGVRGDWVSALPAHLVVGLGPAGVVVLPLHHVQHVALGILGRHLAQRVVRAHDVQVVVQPHLHGVLVTFEPDEERKMERERFRLD